MVTTAVERARLMANLNGAAAGSCIIPDLRRRVRMSLRAGVWGDAHRWLTTGGSRRNEPVDPNDPSVAEQSSTADTGGTVRFYRSDRARPLGVCHSEQSTWTGAVRELDRAPSGGLR